MLEFSAPRRPVFLLPLLMGGLLVFYSALLQARQESGQRQNGGMQQAAWVGSNTAEKEELGRYLGEAQLVGSGTFAFAFWDVYDANLYSASGQFDSDKPFALELVYHRNFNGKDIADRSAELIRQQGFEDEIRLASWHSQMAMIFPDVQEGTRLTGVRTQQGFASFLLDGQPVGEIRDRAFARYFFNIWLGPDTKAPQLREQLVGTPDYANISR